MRTRTTLAAAAALLLASLTACEGSDVNANPQACKKALYEQYRDTVANGDNAPTSENPTACNGVDDATLKSLAGEAVKEYLASDDAEKVIDDAVADAIDDAPFEDVTPAPEASLNQEFADPQQELLQQELLANMQKEIDDAVVDAVSP